MAGGQARGEAQGAAVGSVDSAAKDAPDLARVQRRTVWTLGLAQVVGGVGVGSAISVGGLVAEDLTGSQSWAGLASTMLTLGAAVLALPLAGMAVRRGRRVALGLGWLLAAAGAAVAIAGADAGLFPVFLIGMMLIGSGTATNLQSRYAAADLADSRTRARDLSTVLWATTVGAVAGPNLTGPGAAVAHSLGISELLGPFVFAVAAFGAAGAVIVLLLRPDPLRLAQRRAADHAGTGRVAPKPSLRASMSAITAVPMAVLALAGVVFGHTIMVMVMSMTPVHMSGGGTALTIVGLTLSLHIAGMYALSPVVGWLADRFGRVAALLIGQAVLLLSALVTGLAGHSEPALMAGLVLLGLGWSFSVVAGSALLAESVAEEVRPGAQGLSDLLMSLFGAVGGAASGAVLGAWSFGGLNTVAALLTVPVIVLGVRALLARRGGPGTSAPVEREAEEEAEVADAVTDGT